MSENGRVRASIDATLTEIVQGHAALGLPVDEDEFLDAWETIDRIERQLSDAKATAWRERWAKARGEA